MVTKWIVLLRNIPLGESLQWSRKFMKCQSFHRDFFCFHEISILKIVTLQWQLQTYSRCRHLYFCLLPIRHSSVEPMQMKSSMTIQKGPRRGFVTMTVLFGNELRPPDLKMYKYLSLAILHQYMYKISKLYVENYFSYYQNQSIDKVQLWPWPLTFWPQNV